MMSDKFGIYAWPAYASKKFNPYNYLIYSNIEKQGYKVYDFIFEFRLLVTLIFSRKYKILHIHWPHHYLIGNNSRTKSWFRIVGFHFFIKIIKLVKKRIVYTVHNLSSHENRYPDLQKWIDRILYNNVNGFISLNKYGIELLEKKIKSEKKQKVIYIPHPHYKGYYLDDITQDDARRKLGILNKAFVFLFLGQIKPYKNLPNFIDAYNTLQADDKVLLIAGSVHNNVDYLNKYVDYSSDIKFYNNFVEDDDLQIFLKAADLVVTPYTKIFNSGSVFLNLSFNKPTLGPQVGVFSELKSSFGSGLIKTYEGNISSEVLKLSMKETIAEKNEGVYASLDNFNPDVIARETINFYRSLLAD
jgi:glycosyltransferase involved in cell wall biosynthesis